jgi:hypothetical protein
MVCTTDSLITHHQPRRGNTGYRCLYIYIASPKREQFALCALCGDWLSRRSHHTAQRTVPFWANNAETSVPRVHTPDCRPSARDPHPRRSPLHSQERPATLPVGTAHLFSTPQGLSVPTHFISNLHTSPSFSKLHNSFTSSAQVHSPYLKSLHRTNTSVHPFD